MRWYLVLTLNPLFVTPVFFLLALIAVNAVLRLVRPAWVFSVGEMLIVYIMLAISCTVATHDFVINLMTMVGWGAWFATPENKYEQTLLPHMPRWSMVWDTGALKGFMDGDASLYRASVLGAWLVPLAIWVGFMLVLFGVMLCLNVMVRRAWIEETKLSFPVVRLPMAMVGLDAPRFFASKAMWVGLALPVISGTLNGLAQLYPALPHLQTRAHWPQFAAPPWNMLGAPYSFYPFAIGLGYFVPLDVLFSCWFFYLFIKLQIIVGWYVGLTRLPGFPYMTEQGMGAWATYGVLILYITRQRWQKVLGSLWKERGLEDEGEMLSYRAAFYGVVVGMAALIGFWRVVGMTMAPAVLAVVLYFLLALCITRVRAEAGSQHTAWDLEPMNIFGLVDSRLLGRGNIIGAGMSHWFWRLNRSHAMPTQLEGMRMWQAAGLRPRDLLWPIVAATVVSSLAGPWAVLHVAYTEGAATKCIGYARWTGYESYGWMMNMLTAGRTLEWPRIIAVLASAGLVMALWVMQARYPWMWLHPLGPAAGNFLIWVWCPFMIAWAVKYAIVRFGGQKVYKAMVPFFLGLVLGDYVTGAVWSMISQMLKVPGYQIFH
jgi:phage shock protein PspC (stress-responsive transcriptional regulator)